MAVAEQAEPPQWMQQMLGLMMMRDLQPPSRSLAGPSQSHRSPSTPSSSPPKRNLPSADSIPSLEDWFKSIEADSSRNLSNAAGFLHSLRQQDIEDLSDFINFTSSELVNLSGMTIGLAKRLLGYAKDDMGALHKPKRSRNY